MKKVFLAFFLYGLLVPSHSYSATSEEIKKFFEYDQGKLLDLYWVRPREIYNEWSNGSRFMRSSLSVTYLKKVNESFFDGFKEYLCDTPLSWSHELNYRTILHQLYRKEVHPTVEEYTVRENASGQLEVVHKNLNFVIGTFDINGRYDYRGYYVGMVDVDFWHNVFYDPWDQRMYFQRFIEKEDEKRTHVDLKASADQFLFRFKNDLTVQKGKIEVASVPGFNHPVALFNYQGRVKPLSRNVSIDSDWDRSRPTVSFDVNYEYDEREFFITPDGLVQFSKTLEEFLAP